MTIRPLALSVSLLCLVTGCHPTAELAWSGYAEGEFLALSAPVAGYLATLDAPRGTRVRMGTLAFTLATDPDAQSAASADARVVAAQARAQNLATPRRLSEIAALEATIRAAAANRDLAQMDYTREATLAEKHLVAVRQLDAARTQRDAADAALAVASQTLATARESLGRSAEVLAARSDLDAARAEADQKHWALARKQVISPSDGQIADTYYRPGEWVASGAPVASLLPDSRRRIRFYVAENELGRLKIGTVIEAHCDGCATDIRGTVDYMAPQAEYTPPVIYSRETRAHLVFRVEAAPAPRDAMQLRPGQPLDVRLAR
jgi:HlyD family secretion protein